MCMSELQRIQGEISDLVHELLRPSRLFKPSLSREINGWMAVYGESCEKVEGFGESPELAMIDFDKAWHSKTN